MKTALVFFLLVSVAKPALGFNEPDSFMGIKFFSELGESIGACKRERHQHEADTRVCFYPEKNGSHNLKYVDIGFGYISYVEAFTVAKKFARLDISFGLRAYSTVLPVFRERYGQPTRAWTETWTSRAGTTAPNEIFYWEGKRVSILFRQRSDRVDMSSIVYETDLWREFAGKAKSDWVKDKAKGL